MKGSWPSTWTTYWSSHRQLNTIWHWKVVSLVLEVLQKHQLYLKAKKCSFECPTVEYLGLILSEGHVKMDLVKVAGIKEWPTPKNMTEVQSFVGFINFY